MTVRSFLVYNITMKKICTLCFVERDGKILLGKKKRGFGVGRWNGFGGKVEGTETLFEALKREGMEEFSLTLSEERVEKVAELYFKVLDNDAWKETEIHVYYGTCDGEPVESEELEPAWFPKDALPYDEMWVDDRYWLPLVLEGKNIIGRFTLTETNVLSSQDVKEVTGFDKK